MPNSAASRLVLGPYSEEKVMAAARETLEAVGGQVSCAFVFTSSDYRPVLSDFLELVQVHGHVPTIVGCSGAGLIAMGLEAEGVNGFSLLFLNLPDTELIPFTFDQAMVEALTEPRGWHERSGVENDDVDAWIAIGNPVTLPLEEWLDQWNAAFPGVPTIGGLASGGRDASDIFVIHDRKIVESCVAIGFRGGVRVHTIVSQGCRPVGEPLTITGAEQNIVTSLGSRPAFERLTETFETLPADERAHAAGNLFAGLAMSEYVDEYKTGDFVVRNLIAADPASGALAIGAHPRIGQTLQFQLRDRQSANADLLRMLLEKSRQGVKPFASLVFACNGRGRHLFGVPNHDASALREQFGPVATAGIFCNGEIGPVGGKNFAHGYTASIALFADA
ncbi:MAG TPA: FIST N-terminal domain-containing protein [Chthoniobacteraceae bacterium]|jgi:small ligand-binding sensory domain FIST